MNFRERVQDIIAGQANPAADAFEGYAGLRPGRVSGNARENVPERAPECGNGDTFLESFKRRSEYQFFCGKKPPVGGPVAVCENGETRPGQEPPEPPKASPLIPPEMVQAAVEREVRRLRAIGRTGPDAMRDAIEIARAKVRNSEALAEHQTDISRCHVCEEANDDVVPVIAVMTGKPGRVLYLHAGCHEDYSKAMTEKVDAVMSAAGYGAKEG